MRAAGRWPGGAPVCADGDGPVPGGCGDAREVRMNPPERVLIGREDQYTLVERSGSGGFGTDLHSPGP